MHSVAEVSRWSKCSRIAYIDSRVGEFGFQSRLFDALQLRIAYLRFRSAIHEAGIVMSV